MTELSLLEDNSISRKRQGYFFDNESDQERHVEKMRTHNRTVYFVRAAGDSMMVFVV